MTISAVSITMSGPSIVGRTIPIIPNSFGYDEGTPEKKIRAVVVGSTVQQDYSEDYTEAFSTFKFSVASSADMLDLTRSWESAQNTLLLTATGTEVVRGITKSWRRSFTDASVTKPTKPTGSDAVIEINGMSNAAT